MDGYKYLLTFPPVATSPCSNVYKLYFKRSFSKLVTSKNIQPRFQSRGKVLNVYVHDPAEGFVERTSERKDKDHARGTHAVFLQNYTKITRYVFVEGTIDSTGGLTQILFHQYKYYVLHVLQKR